MGLFCQVGIGIYIQDLMDGENIHDVKNMDSVHIHL